MRTWGFLLIAMSIASAILPQMGMQLILLAWVDMWGTDAGWLIRAALVVAGVALVVIDMRRKKAEAGS